METLLFLLFLIFVVPAILKCLTAAAKNRELAELRKVNPEAWARAQQLEHEQKLMEHQRKMLKHDRMKTGLNVANIVAHLFMKK